MVRGEGTAALRIDRGRVSTLRRSPLLCGEGGAALLGSFSLVSFLRGEAREVRTLYLTSLLYLRPRRTKLDSLLLPTSAFRYRFTVSDVN